MIIFLYGQDSFRSRQKLEEIVAHYKESGKSGLNLISLDAKDINFSDFYDNFKISSMFAEKKLIILKNVFANKNFQEDFIKEVKSIEELKYVGNDLWRLSGEISKLSSFKKDGTVKKDDIELFVKPRIELDIFKTIDALAAKNKKQALALLHKHLDGGEVPLYLLSMIAYQFKNLLIVKELAQKGLMYASIVKKSGLHPFVVKKTYFMCNQFS